MQALCHSEHVEVKSQGLLTVYHHCVDQAGSLQAPRESPVLALLGGLAVRGTLPHGAIRGSESLKGLIVVMRMIYPQSQSSERGLLLISLNNFVARDAGHMV